MMSDVIGALVIVAIVGAAVAYIVSQKRKGVKCIGCSAGKSCGSSSGSVRGAQDAAGECCCSCDCDCGCGENEGTAGGEGRAQCVAVDAFLSRMARLEASR